MTKYRFILSEDNLSAGGWAEFSTGGASRLLFCLQGSIGLGDFGMLSTHQAIVMQGTSRINTGHDGAILWRWELLPLDQEIEDDVAGLTSKLISEVELELDDMQEYIFRCQTLGLPAGDHIAEHNVLGPTFSAILEGNITLNRQGHLRHLGAMETWFDDGKDAVKFNVEEEDAAIIIKAQLLPLELKNKPGISFVNSQDNDIIDNDEISRNDGGDGLTRRFNKINSNNIILI